MGLQREDRQSGEVELSRFQCRSELPRLDELAALCLFLHGARSIWTDRRRWNEHDVDALEQRYREALARASNWHRSTLIHPYPESTIPRG